MTLIGNGANVNAEGGDYGTALQAASRGGHAKLAELLIEKGAKVNTQGGEFGNTLRAASLGGHQKVAEILFTRGATAGSAPGRSSLQRQPTIASHEQRRAKPNAIQSDFNPRYMRLRDSTVASHTLSWHSISDLLTSSDFQKCHEPWHQSSILRWLHDLTKYHTQSHELSVDDVQKTLAALFKNKAPTIQDWEIEEASLQMVLGMLVANALVPTLKGYEVVPETMNGVIVQLSGSGCYSPTLHDSSTTRESCYSFLCRRPPIVVNP